MNNNQEIKQFANFLNRLSGNELALIGMVSGYVISQGLTSDQLGALGNFFELVGQVMLTIGAQEQNLENSNKVIFK